MDLVSFVAWTENTSRITVAVVNTIVAVAVFYVYWRSDSEFRAAILALYQKLLSKIEQYRTRLETDRIAYAILGQVF